MILLHRERVFSTNLFYATCDQCNAWIKSSVGQYIWTERRQMVHNAEKHRCVS